MIHTDAWEVSILKEFKIIYQLLDKAYTEILEFQEKIYYLSNLKDFKRNVQDALDNIFLN